MRADATRQFRYLVEQDERRNAAALPPDHVVAVQNMSFRQLATGEHFFYEFRKHSIPEQIRSLNLRTNRHYQWLLVEAYEHFEDFLEQAYSAAALVDKNIWPLRDYGTNHLGDLEKISFEKLHELAREKKDKPYSLLNPLREHRAIIKKYENNNALDINPWFLLHLIEKLRHHIVHTKGEVNNREKFSTDVLKKSGLHNNGKPDELYKNWIDSFFIEAGSTSLIHLLERPIKDYSPLNFHINVFEETSNHLLSYAHLIASSFTNPEPKKGV